MDGYNMLVNGPAIEHPVFTRKNANNVFDLMHAFLRLYISDEIQVHNKYADSKLKLEI